MNMPIGVIPEIGMMCVAPARSTRRAKPAAVKGEPRSNVNTKADLGSCSPAAGEFDRRLAMRGRPIQERPGEVQRYQEAVLRRPIE
jgi:hypothetical protein